MDNIKIIDYALLVIEDLKTLVESWKTKPFVDTEEQKKAGGMLVQLLSNVWLIDCVAGAHSKESKASADKTDDLKKDLQEILSAVDKLHEKLTLHPVVLELPALPSLPDEEQTLELDEELPPAVPDAVPPQQTPATAAPEVSQETPQDAPQEMSPVKQPPRSERTAPPKQASPYPSLFNKFAPHDEDRPALYTPVNNLAEAIGLNDKFIFIKELFNNNEKEFSKALVRLDNMSGLEEAQAYFSTRILTDTNRTGHAAKQFGSLLIRRYMSR
ncbi:MAG: hypothetical protein LBS12_03020 [Prevotellaceae bacterium]|jgi:hypothetical protein|nr:hypothetical protein [Prevotellaceae bacterium]